MRRLQRDNCILVLIDLQERMLPVVDRHEAVATNAERLIRGCHTLGVPVLVTEQYVKGLGPTIEKLRNALEETWGYRPIEKNCFSAQGCEPFERQLAALERMQVLIAGVEAHVCIYQTTEDLMRAGYEVTLVADAVSSRSAENKEVAIRRMIADGAKISSTEMALFELLVTAGTDEFKAISKLVK